MTHDITPCLFFRDKALEAARFDTDIFPGSRLGDRLEGPSGSPPVAAPFVIDGAPSWRSTAIRTGASATASRSW